MSSETETKGAKDMKAEGRDGAMDSKERVGQQGRDRQQVADDGQRRHVGDRGAAG